MDISFVRRGIKLSSKPGFGSVQELAAPEKVMLRLKQEAGSPCKPVVKAGDTVKVGQVVAEGVRGTADLHSPISGEVKAVNKEIVLADGSKCEAIVIINDGAFTSEDITSDPNPLSASNEELLERIRKAGVVKVGREAKSLAAVIGEALSARGYLQATGETLSKPVDHVAIRFKDVDPHLGALDGVSNELKADNRDFSLGLKAITKITATQNIHFVFDKCQNIVAFEKMANDNDFNIVRVDGDNYPSLEDPLVAKAVCGKEPLVAFRRTHESGVLVIDVDLVVEVGRAVRDKAAVVDKVITVFAPKGTKLVRAKIGTPLTDIVDGDYGKVILGGPMQGQAVHSLDFSLGKDINAITLIPKDAVVKEVNDPCVSCGLCAMACPMRLVPGMLSRYCEFSQWESAEQAHIFNCIECGVCAYVCPAGRSMVQFMVQGKTEILAMRRSGND